jgi:hypothetical protein
MNGQFGKLVMTKALSDRTGPFVMGSRRRSGHLRATGGSGYRATDVL